MQPSATAWKNWNSAVATTAKSERGWRYLASAPDEFALRSPDVGRQSANDERVALELKSAFERHADEVREDARLDVMKDR